MNKIKYALVAISLLLTLPAALKAQSPYIHQISVDHLEVSKATDIVTVQMEIVLDGLNLRSNDLLRISPALRMKDSGEVVELLPPVQIEGRKRSIVQERKASTGIRDEWDTEALQSLRRKNGTAQRVTYSYTIPRKEWMSQTDLLLVERVYGCADCFKLEETQVLRTPFLTDPYQPNYQLSYIVPKVEPVKARADKHTAVLNFRCDKHDLDPNYKGNGQILSEVRKGMDEITGDENIKVTQLSIVGYASPEGSFNHNKALAERRSNSFAQYLAQRYHLPTNQLHVSGYGEDWVKTREVIEASSIQDKDEILRIIDEVANPDARDAHLKRLSRGETYQIMLRDYYPQIRRTEYTVAYEVKAFDVAEAREVIKVNPRLLSLNEMYLVAKSYPANSPEFKQVFDIATRMYPDEPVAIINASASDIEAGSYQVAIDRLSKLQHDPSALNNIGIAYSKLGNYEQAKSYLEQAKAQGSQEAAANLVELEKLLQSL